MKVACAVLLCFVAAVSASGFYAGYGYGYYPYGYGAVDGHNHEFDYRQFPGYPVHVGDGRFYFLGTYPGSCATSHPYSFYFVGDADSFVVCDHGRAHRFACPKGTKNRATSYFNANHPYGLSELCGVNTNTH